jgi:hypothetical protein
MKPRSLPTAFLLISTLAASHAGAADETGLAPPTLAQLAEKADFIALAQVRDTDYRLRREIPVSGSAYLRVLIPYKGDPVEDMVEVYEKGLHEHECYFPNPTVMEEGRRYLVFLRRDPAEPRRYLGLPEGCAVDVLVDRDNRYAVRLPVTGLAFSDPLEALGEPMQFSDAYATVDDDALPPALRDSMKTAGQIAPYAEEPDLQNTPRSSLSAPPAEASRRWRYTQGVQLTDFRALMRLDTDQQAR